MIETGLTASCLKSALASVGLSWTDLSTKSSEILVFGSQAANLARQDSDWDVMCVGYGQTRRTPELDLLWLSPAELASNDWLESELAGHIANYGRWLVGQPKWLTQVRRSQAAIRGKQQWLARRLRALSRQWHGCSPELRRHYAKDIRRNLQRYALLADGMAVPASPTLDQWWTARKNKPTELTRLATQAGVASEFFTLRLLSYTQSKPSK